MLQLLSQLEAVEAVVVVGTATVVHLRVTQIMVQLMVVLVKVKETMAAEVEAVVVAKMAVVVVQPTEVTTEHIRVLAALI
jgi:hypothetical protein